jgi:hypothetical protein
VKNLEKYKEVVAALLVVFIAIVWLSFPNLWFHVFFAITIAMVLGVLSRALYLISAQDKKDLSLIKISIIKSLNFFFNRINKIPKLKRIVN